MTQDPVVLRWLHTAVRVRHGEPRLPRDPDGTEQLHAAMVN